MCLVSGCYFCEDSGSRLVFKGLFAWLSFFKKILKQDLFTLFYVSEGLIWMFVHCVCAWALRGQKWALDSLGLELWMVLNTWVPGKPGPLQEQVLLIPEPVLRPLFFLEKKEFIALTRTSSCPVTEGLGRDLSRSLMQKPQRSTAGCLTPASLTESSDHSSTAQDLLLRESVTHSWLGLPTPLQSGQLGVWSWGCLCSALRHWSCSGLLLTSAFIHVWEMHCASILPDYDVGSGNFSILL